MLVLDNPELLQGSDERFFSFVPREFQSTPEAPCCPALAEYSKTLLLGRMPFAQSLRKAALRGAELDELFDEVAVSVA